METFFCINCGYTQEDYESDITEIEDLEKRDLEKLRHFTRKEHDAPEAICGECTNHYFHEQLCTMCHEYGDYCRGHGFEEQKAYGNCEICDHPVGYGADPEEHGDWCRGHSLLELREHYESTTENQSA